jgi:hypothetical protein
MRAINFRQLFNNQETCTVTFNFETYWIKSGKPKTIETRVKYY